MVIGGFLQSLSVGREKKVKKKLDEIVQKDVLKLSRKDFIKKYENNSKVKVYLEDINGERNSRKIPFFEKIDVADLGSYYDGEKKLNTEEEDYAIEFLEKFPRLLREEREEALKLSKDDFKEKILKKYYNEFAIFYISGNEYTRELNWRDTSKMMETAWEKYNKGYIFGAGLNKNTAKKHFIKSSKIPGDTIYNCMGYGIFWEGRKESDYIKGSYNENKKSDNLTSELQKLNKLYKDGALSKEEFTKAKNKLLK